MRTMSRKSKENATGYLFILPNIVGFILFTAFPVGFSLVMSLTDRQIFDTFAESSFIGLTNFIDVFKDSWFINSILNNLYFLLFIPVQMFLALVCAVIFNSKFLGANAVRMTIYLPYITSFVAISLIWFQLLHPSQGIINEMLKQLGVEHPPSWLGSSLWVKPSILLILTWQTLGYKMLLYLAGLQGVPGHLYEAAEIDGAGPVRKFFSITMPLISSVTFFILIISIIDSFMMWSTIQVLTGGGPGTSSTVIGYYIYKTAFENDNMGYASALSWVLFFIVLIVSMMQWWGQKKWVNY
ncbi:carbohydrate ABC transporter permease [Paenibacillus eucommiae]|uniref:Multiple sugar transport system permease protein n=1 Tax=Paenibacillus eucommiae TaxID=1355755 RepID=A0ABS4IXU3_9BACL|nr:sugar ABC transporter permease [Paenibacillus eucommiae]MBP1992406.1 multiple sugar transport system permease protein [Paenibacillus eucommiae]